MVVCNANFGATGWVGINENQIIGGRIVSSVAKMNEYYLRNGGYDHRRFTMCHEIGHGLGLPHTDEDPYNRNLGDCLDYTDDPEQNVLPGEVNMAKLREMYLTRRRRRVQVSNQQECTIIYRTLRVFSQKNLLPLIELAVENRSNKINSPTRQNTQGYKNSSFSQQSLHYNSNETESSAFHKTRPIVQALIKSCQEILRKKFHFYRKINAEIAKKQSWMEWLSSFGDDNSTQKGNSQKDKENQQIANRLKDSIQFLSDLFNVDIPEVQITEATELEPGSPSRQNNKLGNRLENQFNDSVDDFAEFDLDDENTDVTLTSKGRDELMSSGGGKHAPITVKSHYDDLPCMSMEVGILLVITQFFGNLISSNKKIETWLEKLEKGEPGVFNDYGRFWFMTAPNGLSYKKARISVRFLAHLSFWFSTPTLPRGW